MIDHDTQRIDAIRDFWFSRIRDDAAYIEERQKLWFGKSDAVDRQIRERFGDDLKAAARGERDHWARKPKGLTALIVLLDQFSRNLHRGTPEAFAQDAKALTLALDAIEAGQDRNLHPVERVFVYLPLEHAEDRAMQRRSVELFASLRDEASPELRPVTESWLDFAERHRTVIERFGRFPHRNAILRRASEPEEVEFLGQPGSSF